MTNEQDPQPAKLLENFIQSTWYPMQIVCERVSMNICVWGTWICVCVFSKVVCTLWNTYMQQSRRLKTTRYRNNIHTFLVWVAENKAVCLSCKLSSTSISQKTWNNHYWSKTICYSCNSRNKQNYAYSKQNQIYLIQQFVVEENWRK